MHLAVDLHGIPVSAIITAGATENGTQAGNLIEGITAAVLIADKGYASVDIVENALQKGIKPVIPPRKNRRNKWLYCGIVIPVLLATRI